VDVRVAASAAEVGRGRRGETPVDAGMVREPVGFWRVIVAECRKAMTDNGAALGGGWRMSDEH
jgi:hypothetical protein